MLLRLDLLEERLLQVIRVFTLEAGHRAEYHHAPPGLKLPRSKVLGPNISGPDEFAELSAVHADFIGSVASIGANFVSMGGCQLGLGRGFAGTFVLVLAYCLRCFRSFL